MTSRREPETALEYWLRMDLRERYDNTIVEVIPDSIACLLLPVHDRRLPIA